MYTERAAIQPAPIELAVLFTRQKKIKKNARRSGRGQCCKVYCNSNMAAIDTSPISNRKPKTVQASIKPSTSGLDCEQLRHIFISYQGGNITKALVLHQYARQQIRCAMFCVQCYLSLIFCPAGAVIVAAYCPFDTCCFLDKMVAFICLMTGYVFYWKNIGAVLD